jgi:HK97 gp10 family phage protein
MGFRMRVEGMQELRDNMASLTSATQANIIRRVLVKRAQPIKEMAKQFAPSNTGFLGYSVKIQERTGGAAGRAAFAATMMSGGDKASAGKAARAANRGMKGITEIYIGPNAGPREIAAEFGTKYRAPHAFMRPAWDANRDRILPGLADDMWVELKKAIARKEKRAAKLAAKALEIG